MRLLKGLSGSIWSLVHWVIGQLQTVRGQEGTSPRARLIALITLVSLVMVVVFAAKLIYDHQRIYHLTIATGGEGSEYNTFGKALKKVIEAHQRKIRIELITKTHGSRQSMDWLDQKEVDLALAQNDSPAKGSVRSIALLFPEVLHLYVRSNAGIERVDQLRDRRIATLPEGSGTCSLLESLFEYYGLTMDVKKVQRVQPDKAHELFRDGEVDAVFHIIALGQTAKDYIGPSLEEGAKLLPIEQIDALKSLHPFLEPTTIPKGFYRGYPPQPETNVQTAAVRTVLLAHKQVDKSLVYEITRILHEHRNELVTENPLAAEIKPPDEPEKILFPLHPGAKAYYDREKPGFLVTYAEPLALFLSITVLCTSGMWHLRLRLQMRQKNHADKYNLEILNLLEQLREIENLHELQKVRQKLFDIFRRVLEDLDRDRISAESFQLFTFPWEVALGAMRHHEWTLMNLPPNTQASKEQSDTGLKQ
jgi:TRAP transporter TAXI family solute receptor